MTSYDFDRLVGAVSYIVGHADTPEKPLAVSECLDDIEDRFTQGDLSLGQRRRLFTVLLGVDSPPYGRPVTAETPLPNGPSLRNAAGGRAGARRP